MTVKINNRYKLSKEYLDSLTIKPSTDLVTVSLMYGDVVSFSDGKTTFTDRIVNIIPHLQEPDFRFNIATTSQAKKPEAVAPVVVPKTPDPAPQKIPDTDTQPQTTPPVILTPPVVDPTPPEPQDNVVTPPSSNNPYDDNYI